MRFYRAKGNFMKTAAVICEYNPFHNGHKYHLEQTRKQYGATHIVCVMSGNFTQRGDVAIADKYSRARAALYGGADLVVELPTPFALSSAEHFAMGACRIADALGCVDMLSFGSECGDISVLEEAAGAVHYATECEEFFDAMRKGESYPLALKKTVELYYTPDVVKTLTEPNNTLAVEYIRALDKLGGIIKPVTVMRSGAAHDSDEGSDTVVSAFKLRKMLSGGNDVSAYTDFTDYGCFAHIENIETAILAKLRTMSKSEFERLPNGTGGMDSRIYKAVRTATSLPQLMLMIKSKNFTMARIRRLILCAFLGITGNDLKNPPAYVRILGMNDKGKEILAAGEHKLPVDTSLAALAKTGPEAAHFAKLEERAGNLYALALDKRQPCGTEFTSKPVII